MKVLLAPNAFKGSVTGKEAARAMAEGIERVGTDIDIIEKSVADGGDGTLEALVHATDGEMVSVEVKDPLQRPVESEFGITGDGQTAVVEMARASGLALLDRDEYDPLHTTTAGTGELMREALERGCTKIIVGIGGSATVDGGVGMARELGYRFLDSRGNEVNPGGGFLGEIETIDTSNVMPEMKEADIQVACDVRNLLTGKRGAARVYAPQKGASSEDVDVLEANLSHLQDLLRRELDIDVSELEGGGAAGGLGAGLYAFCNAELRKGVELVFGEIKLEESIYEADLVLTGEGELDRSSLDGKAAVEVARLSQSYQTPCVLLCGKLPKAIEFEYEELFESGATAVFSILNRPMSLEEGVGGAEELLVATTENVVRTYLAGS